MKHPWQRKKAQRDHSDDWLMTYADMITLLLCFFVVFLFTTISKQNNTEAQSSVSNVTTAQVQTIPEAPPSEKEPERTPKLEPEPSAPPVEASPVPAAVSQPAYALAVPQPVLPAPQQPDVLMGNLPFHDPALDQPEAPKPLAEEAETTESPKAHGSAAFEQKGERLTTMEMSSGAFFASGSAELSEAGKAILRDVATKIQTDMYKDYQVTVEGHTDDSPIKTTQFPSNWELSTARASAVVHFFLENGIAAQKLRAAGYADSFPKLPNRDEAGQALPENQAQNRRVVIKLEKLDRP